MKRAGQSRLGARGARRRVVSGPVSALAAGAIAIGLAAASPVAGAQAAGAAGASHLRAGVADSVSAGTLQVPGLKTASGHAPGIAHITGGGQSNILKSTNWSGLVGRRANIHGAKATWRVPRVASSSTAKYSSTWVGVDGAVSGDSKLIQLGTSQDTKDGYWAWTETLPRAANPIRRYKVKPGDFITAYVQRTRVDRWKMYISDRTRHWSVTRMVNYKAPGKTAEWIEEAPTLLEGGRAVQSKLADFGHVTFGSTEIWGRFGSGLGWYKTSMSGANRVEMLNPSGTRIIAVPGDPTKTSTGQKFTDRKVNRPA